MQHGTHSAYSNGGCRCAVCRRAIAEYRRRNRAKNPEQYARQKSLQYARARALTKLGRAHPDELRRLIAAERRRA